ncbi:UDP-glucosyltransferase 2-like [Adelges cooleyi]|uniref:UDP-glucosyltransferase 2-like n=1 Tax=Adelges cooleyi TaxID=133065 RepID=UPI00218014DD|nr:UDP-glucosyltransferase 2-like [Adelges cooleyi]
MTRVESIVIVCILEIASMITAPLEGARILAIETLAGKSHWNAMSHVLQVLVDRGHNVTVFTPFVDGNRENYTEIDLSEVMLPIVDLEYEIVERLLHKVSTYIPLIVNVTRYNCYITYSHQHMQDILAKSGEQSEFDVVITEPLASECVSYVATKLKLPLIYVVPSTQITFIEWQIFGYMSNPSVTSHLMADHVVPETFVQRFSNTILTVYSLFLLKRTEYQMKTIFPQPFDEAEPTKCSLIFSNTHYINDSPGPHYSNLVQIGGIHLKPPKQLPEDILEFIENSPYGIIYVTFGTMVDMSTLPNHILNIFKEVLSQMPQKVLWKYPGTMENQPENVMTKSYFPQRDILLHPNIKLFISHGGISGVHETVDAGVPVLGFPLFFDQSKNLEALANAGMAISLDFFSVSKETFLGAIIELVSNVKYTENAKIAAQRFMDRPMTPAQSVVYWTEYIIRNKDLSHLKNQTVIMTWYQYLLLDVIVILVLGLILSLYLLSILYKVAHSVVIGTNIMMVISENTDFS